MSTECYAAYAFRIRFGGRPVAGFSRVSALQRTSTVLSFRDGSDPQHERKAPGPTGSVAFAWQLHRCWVSEFQAQPALDADGSAIAITTLRVEHEGWTVAP